MVGMALLALILAASGLWLGAYLLARVVAKAARRKRTWVFSHLRECDGDPHQR